MVAFLESVLDGKVKSISVWVSTDGCANVVIHHSGEGSPMEIVLPRENGAFIQVPDSEEAQKL